MPWVRARPGRPGFSSPLHVRLLQAVHEFGISRVVQAGGGVDLNLPQAAGFALLQAAVDVGVAAGFADGNFGQLDAGLALPAVALRSGEEVLAVLDVVGASFDAHRLGVGSELTNCALVGLVCQLIAALVAGNVARLTGVEVVLARHGEAASPYQSGGSAWLLLYAS